MMNIPQYQTEDLIEVLEPFQQDLLKSILCEHTEEEALEIWMQVTGPEHTASFGGDGIKDYLKHFRTEFDLLILGDEKYSSIIKEFNEHKQVTKYFVVSSLSVALASSLGVAAGVVAPLIVLALGALGKLGLNAYRDSIKDRYNKE